MLFRSYSKKDARIQVHSNQVFVDIISNHNIAFRLISPDTKYCKVVSADDLLFPDCITRMVEVAETYPSAGFVGCYQISENYVKWQGFPYPGSLLNGRDLCRRMLLSADSCIGFGAPTSLLYRADLVRITDTFFPNRSPHADTSAIYASLKDCDFGFVHQVLCWERVHEGMRTTQSHEINEALSSSLDDLIQYGRYYLSEQEWRQALRKSLSEYNEFLAVSFIRFREKEFWDYHKCRLQELGYPMNTSAIIKAGWAKVRRELLNPERALRKLRQGFASSMRR